MAATPASTKRYADRMKSVAAPSHFREQQGLMMSSIGLGTYLGEADSHTDDSYIQAITRAVDLGVNVIDTAINYRFQRSERCIGRAITELSATGRTSREELIIATKAGFISFDGAPPVNPREWFTETFVRTGIIGTRDLVSGSHCMAPRYLEHQLDQSLRNLGLHSVDIFYVHNPEIQLSELSRDEFYRRLRVAFGFLEGAVSSGKIGMYGTATWNAYRSKATAADFVSIEDVVQCARDVAGEGHHFRVVQLPYNLAMAEAFTDANQTVNGNSVTMLEASRQLGLTVMASASIFQARLSRNLPPMIGEELIGFETDSQRAIQFVRSTPGIAVSLVGMSQVRHVEENLLVARVPPAPEAVARLFDAA